MKQTATEWLREKLQLEFGFIFSDNILEQAKEMEKEQINEAYEEGYNRSKQNGLNL
jgi:flagellar biosynthesis/type III secretory pathway protein FliH